MRLPTGAEALGWVKRHWVIACTVLLGSSFTAFFRVALSRAIFGDLYDWAAPHILALFVWKVPAWVMAPLLFVAGFAGYWLASLNRIRLPAPVIPTFTVTADSTEALMALPVPSTFRCYTFDTFLGMTWRWQWPKGVETPHPDSVLDLAAFCPKCRLRIEPKEHIIHSDRPYGAEARPPAYQANYRCDMGCTVNSFPGSVVEVESSIRRLVERAAYNQIYAEEIPEAQPDA